MIQSQDPSPSPYRSAALGLTLFVVGGFFAALAAGVVWGGQSGWLVFGGAVIVGLLWSVMLMSATINHKAYLERRIVDAQAAKIENESSATVIAARTQEWQVAQHARQHANQQMHLSPAVLPLTHPSSMALAATQTEPPDRFASSYCRVIRVFVVPRKGQGRVFECSPRLIQWAISDCWPIAAREYSTTQGQKVRVWKHRDQDFTDVAQFMVGINAWAAQGASYEWRAGINQTVMIRWYHEALRNGGDAGQPEALSEAALLDGN